MLIARVQLIDLKFIMEIDLMVCHLGGGCHIWPPCVENDANPSNQSIQSFCVTYYYCAEPRLPRSGKPNFVVLKE